ncbi:SecDF P1 head subdomain-containing protein [Flavivirga eckloniae]|uniref:Uncharacterized protein n=1 Tax=Flavivirga eckloniae TaxID=1803846 RepID=A0A2K9PTN6_9FLAO|nr:hypothetical protein [Flavivirga eckloniae]AUP80426.1 hypothetical protein C1H87_17595 [Flavivirga eckloniae]
MKITYAYLIFALILLSCDAFKEKHEHLFIYGFENKKTFPQQGISETIQVLKKRLDAYGVSDFEVKRYQDKNISVKINAHNLDNERVDRLLLNQGKLEFWELHIGEDFHPFLGEVNDEFVTKEDNDSLKINPLFDRIVGVGYSGGPVLFRSKSEDTAAVNSLLKRNEIKFHLPSEFKNTKFLWGIADSDGFHPLYAAKSNRENMPPLTGEFVKEARMNYDVVGRPCISMVMNEEGALRWERITGNAYRNNTCIAVTLNNLVQSAPGVVSGPIKGGKTEISGNYTLEEAQDLAIILTSQKHIPKLNLLQYSKSKK